MKITNSVKRIAAFALTAGVLFTAFLGTSVLADEEPASVEYVTQKHTVRIYRGEEGSAGFDDYSIPFVVVDTETGESEVVTSSIRTNKETGTSTSSVSFTFEKPGRYAVITKADATPGYKMHVPQSGVMTIVVEAKAEPNEDGHYALNRVNVAPYSYFRFVEGIAEAVEPIPEYGAKISIGVQDLTRPKEGGKYYSFEGIHEIPFTWTNVNTGEVKYSASNYIHGGPVTVTLEDGEYTIEMERDAVEGYTLVSPADGVIHVTVKDGRYTKMTPVRNFAFDKPLTDIFKVTYDINGGVIIEGSEAEDVVIYNKPTNVPTVTSSKGVFEGWADKDGNFVDPTTVVITEDTTFTAIYKIISYSRVRYDAGIGVIIEGSAAEMVQNGNYPTSVPVVYHPFATFIGWEDKNGIIVDPTTVIITTGTTFTAKYNIVEN